MDKRRGQVRVGWAKLEGRGKGRRSGGTCRSSLPQLVCDWAHDCRVSALWGQNPHRLPASPHAAERLGAHREGPKQNVSASNTRVQSPESKSESKRLPIQHASSLPYTPTPLHPDTCPAPPAPILTCTHIAPMHLHRYLPTVKMPEMHLRAIAAFALTATHLLTRNGHTLFRGVHSRCCGLALSHPSGTGRWRDCLTDVPHASPPHPRSLPLPPTSSIT